MGADELTATLCQASMTSVSMKRLTTVLGVAIALARAENITTCGRRPEFVFFQPV